VHNFEFSDDNASNNTMLNIFFLSNFYKRKNDAMYHIRIYNEFNPILKSITNSSFPKYEDRTCQFDLIKNLTIVFVEELIIFYCDVNRFW
jgi:hypothetical protein